MRSSFSQSLFFILFVVGVVLAGASWQALRMEAVKRRKQSMITWTQKQVRETFQGSPWLRRLYWLGFAIAVGSWVALVWLGPQQ